jgi:hypothetical protein
MNRYVEASLLPNEQQLSDYANCDGSLGNPALTANDFVCFTMLYTYQDTGPNGIFRIPCP